MSGDTSDAYQFGLLLVPGFSHLGMSLVIEPLFIANWITGCQLFDWQTLSVDGLAVPASSGAQVPVAQPLGTEHSFDTVLVLASFDARQSARDARVLSWLRWLDRSGTEVGAVETGSEILADAGILGTSPVPTHWYNSEGMRERHPELQLTDGLFTIAHSRPISAGASTTIDMMLALIGRQAGHDLAQDVSQHLLHSARSEVTRQRPFSDPLHTPAANDPIARAFDAMAAQIENPVPCAAIARAAGVSERHLQRLFQERLGRGIAESYLILRMERAHQLVQQTDLSITEIGISCGFSALETFSRTYRKVFKVAPSKDRRQSINNTVFRRLKPDGRRSTQTL
jgi:AraC family carnitine catabolism transcriptional activator